MSDVEFESSVFVNCPFDEKYKSLLRPLLFTILYCGLTPRIASERLDSGENRIDKICEMIAGSKYGIHDISRLKSTSPDEFYRLNMPLELGIDYGVRRYGTSAHKEKRCLILETNPYQFKKALSDLSGVDIKSHGDEPKEVVRAVRDWLYEAADLGNIDPPFPMWYRYNDFAAYLFESRAEDLRTHPGLSDEEITEDIERMPIREYIDEITAWIEMNDFG